LTENEFLRFLADDLRNRRREWLEKAADRRAARDAREEQRADAALALARESNVIGGRAVRVSIIALIISIMSAAIAWFGPLP
jgi:hypothetical protein